MNKEKYRKILGQLRQLCSRSEKCESDVIRKMEEWETDRETQKKIIEELKRENFLNDRRYVRSFVNDKIRFDKWGKVKIRYFLKRKQIEEQVIDEALIAFPVEEYKRICFIEIEKKYKTLRTKHKIAAKQKLISFAMQRGFENTLIFEVVNNILEKA